MIEFSLLLISIGFVLGYFAERFSLTKKLKEIFDKFMHKCDHKE